MLNGVSGECDGNFGFRLIKIKAKHASKGFIYPLLIIVSKFNTMRLKNEWHIDCD